MFFDFFNADKLCKIISIISTGIHDVLIKIFTKTHKIFILL